MARDAQFCSCSYFADKIGMCLAIPGKIVKINGQIADVNFSGAEKEINISLVDAKKGDYIIVHAGFAIEKLKNENAKEIKTLLQK